jgi:hypothetical protein
MRNVLDKICTEDQNEHCANCTKCAIRSNAWGAGSGSTNTVQIVRNARYDPTHGVPEVGPPTLQIGDQSRSTIVKNAFRRYVYTVSYELWTLLQVIIPEVFVIKNVPINMGSIPNGYCAMGFFFLTLKSPLL